MSALAVVVAAGAVIAVALSAALIGLGRGAEQLGHLLPFDTDGERQC